MAGVMLLVFVALYLISLPALIDAVNKVKRGGVYRFGDSFSVGVDFFWRFFGLFLLSFFVGIAAIGLGVAIVAIGFAMHTALGIIALLPIIPIALFGVFVLTNVVALAQRAMVVRNIGIADSLQEAMTLLGRFFGRNVVIFLIWLGLSIAVGVAALIIWAAIGIPIGIAVYASGLGVLPAVLLGLLLGLPISIVLGGFTGTAFTNLYTLFYFELVEPSGPPPSPGPSPGYAAG